jgi:hypothetical protein
LNHPSTSVQEQALSGQMKGNLIQVPLSRKQQKSQTVHNFIQYLAEFYDGFEV